MRNWIKKNFKTIIYTSFVIPIVIVAIVSISHVTKWYGISNPASWAIYLSFGIEIAALSSLAAISAHMGKNVYFPFIVVTLIQFVGNIFFSFQYIDTTSEVFKSWVELTGSLFENFGVDPTDVIGHKRILALFAGGMLPIISLSFLHMLIKFTENERNSKSDEIPVVNDDELKYTPTKDELERINEILISKKPLSDNKHYGEYISPEDNVVSEKDDISFEEFNKIVDEKFKDDELLDDVTKYDEVLSEMSNQVPPLDGNINDRFVVKEIDEKKKGIVTSENEILEVIPNNESTESISDTVDNLFIDEPETIINEPEIIIEDVPNPEIKTEVSKKIPESSFIKIGNKIISRNVSDTRRR